MNEKIFEALTALANKLGTTAEYLWGVLVTQARISAIYFPTLLLMFILSVVVLDRTWKKYNGTDEDDVPMRGWVALGVSCIAGLVGLIGAMAEFSRFVTAVFNPEYAALQKILSAIGGGGE